MKKKFNVGDKVIRGGKYGIVVSISHPSIDDTYPILVEFEDNTSLLFTRSGYLVEGWGQELFHKGDTVHKKVYQVWAEVQNGMNSAIMQPIQTFESQNDAIKAASVAPVKESNSRYIWYAVAIVSPKLVVMEGIIFSHDNN